MSETGKVVLIGGGPGAWDLITVRGMRALQAADVILTDHLGPTNELHKLCDVEAKEVIDVAKLPYSKQVSQERTNELLIEHARAGKNVARLKGGDPFVFGRGFEEVQACAANGVPCEVIPGVTSAVSVPAAVGVPVTQRGMVHAFTVVSGHVEPNDPRSLVDWRALAASGATLCVIMGVRNVAAIAAELQAGGLSADTPAAIIQEGTTEQQRSFRCTLGTLAETFEVNGVTSPVVYVIGDVAGL
ncbi:uroporphyrinogen-III C-methyltransferase [Corynebacterium macclintockiae]|uniref:uroporphyrinogen-III C-methyltransferase n=1 Tax=Corynebacterium macclintockiae TaxID=2913501 RepID=UPI00254A2494|nr:uroporphyrinogen-III C-methyltransferase [Corynebacterium macclintockiae]MDK8890526.1 uroporphyrinogen-III C-methyltransferase [Corynebacterium macclintockiae]